MKTLRERIVLEMAAKTIMNNIMAMNDKDYQDFCDQVEEIGKLSPNELLKKIDSIIKNVDKDILFELIDNSKDISNTLDNYIKEDLQVLESEGVKKSIKELIGEIYPALSFYPALGIWGMVDTMIQSEIGFDALTPEQMRLLPIYLALFFGLVGGKIAYNRIKEKIQSKKNPQN